MTLTVGAISSPDRARAGVLRMVAVLGPTCAGKTTQARALGRQLGLPTIHSGDIVRASLAAGATDYRCCPAGRLPPPHVIAADIDRELERLDRPPLVIVEGFPRSAAQVDALERILHPTGLRICGIYLQADDQVLRRRSLARHREDDDPLLLHRRVSTDRRHFAALKHKLTAIGTFTEIDSTNPPDAITNHLRHRIRHEWRLPA